MATVQNTSAAKAQLSIESIIVAAKALEPALTALLGSINSINQHPLPEPQEPAEAAKSTKTESETFRDLDNLSTAQERVTSAAQTLRAMVGCFLDDGEPQAEIADILGGVRVGIASIKTASNALFDVPGAGDLHDRVEPLYRHLWDTADLVLVVAAALAGKLPTGEGMTICPVRRVLEIASDRLEELDERLVAEHDRVHAQLQQIVESQP